MQESKSRVIILVTGSRNINSKEDAESIKNVLNEQIWPAETLLIHGDAVGVDRICKEWATDSDIDNVAYPLTNEHFDKHSYGAGAARNQEMIEAALEKGYVIHCFAFWDGVSGGTKDMIKRMRAIGYQPHIHLFGRPKTKRLI